MPACGPLPTCSVGTRRPNGSGVCSFQSLCCSVDVLLEFCDSVADHALKCLRRMPVFERERVRKRIADIRDSSRLARTNGTCELAQCACAALVYCIRRGCVYPPNAEHPVRPESASYISRRRRALPQTRVPDRRLLNYTARNVERYFLHDHVSIGFRFVGEGLQLGGEAHSCAVP